MSMFLLGDSFSLDDGLYLNLCFLCSNSGDESFFFLPVLLFKPSYLDAKSFNLGVRVTAGSCSRENLRSLNVDEATLLFATGELI